MAPSLFGLHSMVVLLYQKLPSRSRRKNKVAIRSQGKTDLTFSDVLTAIRRWLWLDVVFETLQKTAPFPKLPRRLEATLLYALAPAA